MLLKLMVESQKELNNILIEDWETANLDWMLAIKQEVAEAVDCFPWKWWKDVNKTIDQSNLIVECVDILHFAISGAVVTKEVNSNNEFSRDVTELMSDVVTNFGDKALEKNGYAVLESLLYSGKSITYTEIIAKILVILRANGESIDDVFKTYMTKNCLNKFRYYHGYKDGTYQKMWNGVEDNVVAMRISKEHVNCIEYAEYLYDALWKEYSKATKESRSNSN